MLNYYANLLNAIFIFSLKNLCVDIVQKKQRVSVNSGKFIKKLKIMRMIVEKSKCFKTKLNLELLGKYLPKLSDNFPLITA
ncbi:hypothetical protein BpHYR1_017761 [Brachionus plicatilis]|uniref:Uncharacterized protein n=1 Tax=Brachionus plicatilis TaxID=10195 RepID=A0A3M7S739_BRAPC|nr:hypothetical protein BpHYR1_017761 [Brachionus plicatilis]